jgi:hypothetical protein
MARPRAADDFAAIRARMEELRRERNSSPPSKGGPPRGRALPGSLDAGDGRPAGSERGRPEERGIGGGARRDDRRGPERCPVPSRAHARESVRKTGFRKPPYR